MIMPRCIKMVSAALVFSALLCNNFYGRSDNNITLKTENLYSTNGELQDHLRWVECKLFLVAKDNDVVRKLSQIRPDPGTKDKRHNAKKRDMTPRAEYEKYRTDDDLYVYCIFGWSGWGGDDMRRISVNRAVLDQDKNIIEIELDYPAYKHSERIVGTADMCFVGWKIGLGRLKPGAYSIKVYGARKTIFSDWSQSPPKESVIKANGKVLEKAIKLTITR